MSSRVTSIDPPRRPAGRPAALLAAASIVLAGCVSNAKYTEVRQERDLLEARNQALDQGSGRL